MSGYKQFEVGENLTFSSRVSELLEAALKKAGVPVTFYTVKGTGHGRFNDPQVHVLLREFLAKYLKQ